MKFQIRMLSVKHLTCFCIYEFFLDQHQSFFIGIENIFTRSYSTYVVFRRHQIVRNGAKMIRKSIAKAFDPLYESPRTSSITANLETITDIAKFTSTRLFLESSDDFSLPNDSPDKVRWFIQDIINEAVSRIIPSDNVNSDINILDLVNISSRNPGEDLLVQIGDEILCSDLQADFASASFSDESKDDDVKDKELLTEEKSDLEPEVVNVGNLDVTIEIEDSKIAKDTINKQSRRIGISFLTPLKEQIELDFNDQIMESPLNICDISIRDHKEEIHNLSRGDSNKIEELTIIIMNKDRELAQIKEEVLRKHQEYTILKIDFEKKVEDMAALESRYKEHEILKRSYDEICAENEKMKSKYVECDMLKKDNETKGKEIAEWRAKYEQAHKEMTESHCSKIDDRTQLLTTKFVAREKEFENIMVNYTELLEAQVAKCQTLSEECCLVKKHLANLEVAFTDVHQKYERSKVIVEGFKSNEENLRSTLLMFQNTLKEYENRTELLQQKNKTENDSLRRELHTLKEEYVAKLNKHLSKIRHLEIKTTSLTNALEQKSKECQDLTKLCEEVIDIQSDNFREDSSSPSTSFQL